MKLETLVTRYKNLGYTPMGLERDLEITSIIRWLFETHDIHIEAMYVSFKINGTKHYKKFIGCYRHNCKEDYSNNFQCEKSFKNPEDAKFDAVRKCYSGLRFQKY